MKRGRAVGASPRGWQRMLSGRRLDILEPSPLDVELADIAHGIARVARWNGQTRGLHSFSVAQHSCLVEAVAAGFDPALSRVTRLTLLLHDASEYVVGDLVTPLKAALGEQIRLIEGRIQAAIFVAFGLPAEPPDDLRILLKRADRGAAWLEAIRLAGFSHDEAVATFGRPDVVPTALDELLEPWPTDVAEERFRARVLGCLDAKPDGHRAAL